ncbi:HAMP domain-containing protein [Ideonella sp. 4Y16]|uniref:histidine kinase n=1 Tax=Ideonella alba TaxID=2824118 RepID=A0A940YCK6_9BURK|nr:sensor histidine kinase [Ideonella alba]MBQ0929900.1 HAMP domain-containing protein [Ideonella alba]MBQ0942133.1 HAMP domain-containing protein [Ideonella alba]
MFRRRLTLVLVLFASVVALAAVLAAASLVVTERQVLRGRVASDIATGFIQLSAQKQRLRTWVAQVQQGANADLGMRSELLAAMQGTLQRLKVLAAQAADLDAGQDAPAEHRQRQDTLALLDQSVAALDRAVRDVQPLAKGVDADQAWRELSRVFDLVEGHDIRRLIAESIVREAAAVQRERVAADSTLAWVRWLWLASAAMLAAGAVSAAIHFGRALRRPLEQLSDGARALQQGQLSHRIPESGDDEFSEVARSVNALAAELEQHRARESADRQRLEELVAARTRELAEALGSLRQADSQRRRLFADISHELRTPTTAIRGEAEITLRGVDKPPAEYKDALARIVVTARQLGHVIDDLLAMARSDIDSLSLVREPVDMDELAHEALAQATALAHVHDVVLAAPPARTGRHLVSGDPMRLRQLVMVLLDNALRYARPGGEVSLDLRHAAGGKDGSDSLVLTVADQGIGIPADELPRVFDRHFRGAEARRRSPDGSGLGLNIARQLAQAHGGRLELRSTEGVGTRAIVTLPLLDAADLGAAVA